MKLIFLFGDAAVGKMTVGQALTQITDLRLFHNHAMIEPVLETFGTFDGALINRLRDVVFDAFAASDRYGMIFTFMWAFNYPSDWAYIENVCGIFTKHQPDTEFVYVELIAPQSVRLERNRTENRLKHKPSKRDIEASDARLLHADGHARCVSNEGEIPFANYLRIENEHIDAATAAQMIKDRFHL